MKNPDTGRRVSRLNPASEWLTTEVPHLRIVSDDVWTAVKHQQASSREAIVQTQTLGAANRPRHLFSGLLKCGACGAGFVMSSANRLACFGARDRATCSNRLTIRRDEVEARVLRALQDKLLNRELFEEFCDEFTREMNRLRMDHRPGLVSAERELERVKREIQKVIDAIVQGVPGSEVKERMVELQRRKEVLTARIVASEQPPPLIRPEMAGV